MTKIKEIVTLAAFYLQEEEILGLPQMQDDFQGVPTDDEALDKLLRCVNLVRSEIASDYYPLLTSENINCIDGRVDPVSLQKRIIDVKRITQNGKAVQFKVYPDTVKTAAGEVEIEYSYLPEDEGLDGDAGFSDKIAARVIAYGAAAEYCLITGLFEEAVIWEKRFKDSLFVSQRKKSEIRVKPRKWL